MFSQSFPHIFAVEVLEPFISKWMYIELIHASKIVGRERFWVYNVKRECEREKLLQIASRVESSSIISSLNKLEEEYNIIILDPSAPVELKPGDFSKKSLVIVGGIMGDHPPRKRTKKELSEKAGGRALLRNIGKGQFTIDGAIYVTHLISNGLSLDRILVRDGLILRKNDLEVYLPYLFPVANGEPVISAEEIEYLLNGIEKDETLAIRMGRIPSICDSL